MKQKHVFILVALLTLSYHYGSAQQKHFSLSGTVRDHTGESLIGVTVRISNSLGPDAGKPIQSGSTDNKGAFNFKLIKGSYKISCSYIGFEVTKQEIVLAADAQLTLAMQSTGNGLKEVAVSAQGKTSTVKSMEMGVQTINLETLKKMPALFGEVDVVRSILTLPGVSSVGEGSSGFNVRGGDVDQNLVLMDGAPVFNTAHLFGLFSVFNPDVVQEVKLVKGGIPSEYGGRLSSVLDIKLKSGNRDSLTVSGGVGTVAARVAAGFPILNNKGSIFIAGRRTYADLFLKASKDKNTSSTVANFQDFNFKAEYTVGAKDQLYLAGYYGSDKLGISDDFLTSYSNANTALTHVHQFSPMLSSKTTALFSQYKNDLSVPQEPESFINKQHIDQYQLKNDWNYHHSGKINLNFGLSAISYKVNPGIQSPLTDNSLFNTTAVANQKANEYGLYLSNTHELSEKLSAQYGARLSYFNFKAAQNGPIYTYGGTPGTELVPISSAEYQSGASVKNYVNVEPRLSLRYLLTENSSVKASYNRMSQYVHLVSATTASTPFDSWLVSTNNIKPELADQFALGYFSSNMKYEISAEGYYKKMNNQIDVINGTEPIGNPDIEKDLVYGNGRSYGLELYLKKKTGRLNGFISYTLSKTERKIDGINNGDWYNAKSDRTHNLNVVGIFDYNKRWSFAANYVYQTGIAATFPSSRSDFQGIVVPYNNGDLRNNYRYKAYTRLDLSATLYSKVHPGSHFSSNWVFSLYNVMNRKNVYALYFKQDVADPTKTIAKQLSVIGSIVPGVTWNFNF